VADLSWLPVVAQGSPWAFLGLGIVAVLTGRLVPAKTMAERMRDRDAQLKDKSDQVMLWHTAYEKESDARRTGEAQVEKLTESVRTTNLLLASLSNKSGGGQQP